MWGYSIQKAQITISFDHFWSLLQNEPSAVSATRNLHEQLLIDKPLLLHRVDEWWLLDLICLKTSIVWNKNCLQFIIWYILSEDLKDTHRNTQSLCFTKFSTRIYWKRSLFLTFFIFLHNQLSFTFHYHILKSLKWWPTPGKRDPSTQDSGNGIQDLAARAQALRMWKPEPTYNSGSEIWDPWTDCPIPILMCFQIF